MTTLKMHDALFSAGVRRCSTGCDGAEGEMGVVT